MKGIWKTNLSGYHKGSKRKRTKIKHLIKDNYNYFRKHITDLGDKYEVVYQTPDTIYYIDFIEVEYKTIINNYVEDGCIRYNYSSPKIGYIKSRFKEGFTDGNTNKILDIDGNFLKWSDILTHKKLIRTDKITQGSKIKHTRFITYNYNFILYGKLQNSNLFAFNRGYRKKSYQKYVNGKDRMLLSTYIKKGDFDKDVKTHEYSKSISWLVC